MGADNHRHRPRAPSAGTPALLRPSFDISQPFRPRREKNDLWPALCRLNGTLVAFFFFFFVFLKGKKKRKKERRRIGGGHRFRFASTWWLGGGRRLFISPARGPRFPNDIACRPRVRLFIIRATDRQCFLVVSLTLLLMFRSAGSGGVTYPRDWPCVILSVGNGRFNQPRSTVYIYTTTTLFRYTGRGACKLLSFFLSELEALRKWLLCATLVFLLRRSNRREKRRRQQYTAGSNGFLVVSWYPSCSSSLPRPSFYVNRAAPTVILLAAADVLLTTAVPFIVSLSLIRLFLSCVCVYGGLAVAAFVLLDDLLLFSGIARRRATKCLLGKGGEQSDWRNLFPPTPLPCCAPS